MESIANLYPEKLWEQFANICTIPHPSKHEDKIVAYLTQFAETHKLNCITDSSGNVIIKKPAAQTCENWPTVALQAHVDMVPQKNTGILHDFETDPIKPYIDGEWVTATDTTLGADNGIGMASILAVLESKDIKHGPIEALFTATEETGMDGAFGLSESVLEAKYMINTDSEDDKEIIVGCAGGMDANISMPLKTKAIPADSIPVVVAISGLKGGHSGIDIHLGRANANKLACEFTNRLIQLLSADISTIKGGNMRNAIPREAFIYFYIKREQIAECRQLIADFENECKTRFAETDPNISLTFSSSEAREFVINSASVNKLIKAIEQCPSQAIEFVEGLENAVKSSNNISTIECTDESFEIGCLIRSADQTSLHKIGKNIATIFKGSTVSFAGEYPGWQPVLGSKLLKTAEANYVESFKRDPEVKVIHAGLECGIIGSKYPDLEMVSIGPTIKYPHSPDEKVNIASVGKYWDYLCLFLQSLQD